MPGHLQKKGSRYYAVLEFRDPATGKRRQKWVATGCTREKDAEAVLRQLLHEQETGQFVEPTKLTVAEYLRQWLPTAGQKSTVYQRNIEKHIIPALGAIRLTQLSPLHLQRYYTDILGHLSASTVALHHCILHAALNQAVKWQMLRSNPADAVSPPRSDKTPPTTWTEEEQQTFLTTARVAGDPLYAAYCMALTTGMRRGEILALRWSDIDMEKTLLSIQRTTTKDGGKYVTRAPKTASSRRTISIPVELVRILKVHRAESRLAIPGYDEVGLVFTTREATLVNPDYFDRAFRKAIERAGVTPITVHAMRHTFATTMLKRGVPMKVVSEMLGHTKIAITADIYSHVTYEMQQEAATLAGEILRRENA